MVIIQFKLNFITLFIKHDLLIFSLIPYFIFNFVKHTISAINYFRSKKNLM